MKKTNIIVTLLVVVIIVMVIFRVLTKKEIVPVPEVNSPIATESARIPDNSPWKE